MPRDISVHLGAQEIELRHSLYHSLIQACEERDEIACVNGDVLAVDVGAGRGELLALFAAKGWKPLGLDPEDECVAAAARHGPCVKGDVSALPKVLDGHRPAVVVCSHVLEHLDDPLDALRTMRSVEASGYVFAVPNVHRPSRMLRTAAGSRRADHPAHVHGWGFPEFDALLQRAAFRVDGWYVDRVTINPFGGGMGAGLTRLLRPVEERYLPRLMPTLSSSIIARCTRV